MALTIADVNVEAADRLGELARLAACDNDRQLRESPFFDEVMGIKKLQGKQASANLLRGVLTKLISINREQIDRLNYPESVRKLIRLEFGRIEEFLGNKGDDYFSLSEHALRCDFRIACFGRIPLGPEHMETSGVSRSLCLRGGLGQFFRFLRMVSKTKGVTRFYQLHQAKGIGPYSFLIRFRPEAQVRMFQNVAECLRMNPSYRGLVVGSWWYDPQLERMSPHLTYLRETMQKGGALLFRYGSTKGALRDGLANSAKRQALYEAGEYIPTSYTIVWPRDNMIQWAESHGISSS